MNTATLVTFGLIAFVVMSAQGGPPPPPPTDCVLGDGTNYRGNMGRTKSGQSCVGWDESGPHEHEFKHGKYNGAGLDQGAFCRNPDGSDTVWCFTKNPKVRFESCIAPVCGKKCHVDGKEYAPGQTWRSKDCTSDCICLDDGQPKCIKTNLQCKYGYAKVPGQCDKCKAPPAAPGSCQDSCSPACKSWFANKGCNDGVDKDCPVTCKACPWTSPAPKTCEDATPACNQLGGKDCQQFSVQTACPHKCGICSK